ncbi:MAG: hypothetical protein EZS28_012077, partial [Streblomastix strix]
MDLRLFARVYQVLNSDQVIVAAKIIRKTDFDQRLMPAALQYARAGTNPYLTKSLESVISMKDIPINSIRIIMKQIFEGINLLHESGFVGNIDASKILLHNPPGSKNIVIKLSNTWLAKSKQEKPQQPSLSRSSSQQFIAPELMATNTKKGGEKTQSKEDEIENGKKVDVWSVGLILYQIVAHGLPDNVKTQQDLQSRLSQNQFVRPDSLKDDLLWDLIYNLLEADPQFRFTAEQALQHEFFNMDKALLTQSKSQQQLVNSQSGFIKTIAQFWGEKEKKKKSEKIQKAAEERTLKKSKVDKSKAKHRYQDLEVKAMLKQMNEKYMKERQEKGLEQEQESEYVDQYSEYSTSRVYQVLNSDQVIVAAKIIRKTDFDERLMPAALQYARAGTNPYLTKVIDIQQSNHFMIILMEYANLPSLESVISMKDIPINSIRIIMKQIFEGISLLHESGFVGNIDASKILLHNPPGSKNIVIKLSNTWLAKSKQEKPQQPSLSRSSSQQFIAPELMATNAKKGGEKTQSKEDEIENGKKVDVWSVGLILYQIVAHGLPDNAKTQQELQSRLSQNQFVRPDSLKDDLLWDLLYNLLEADPQRRFTAKQALQHEFFNLDQVLLKQSKSQQQLVNSQSGFIKTIAQFWDDKEKKRKSEKIQKAAEEKQVEEKKEKKTKKKTKADKLSQKH